jgi:hypothetical protein
MGESGIICGTPLEACSRTSYTIQVASASGKASAVVEVQVLLLPPPASVKLLVYEA